MFRALCLAVTSLLTATTAHAQSRPLVHAEPSGADALVIAEAFLQQQAPALGLRESDLEWRSSDRYRSDHNGVTHIYLQQLSGGIPISQAISTINVLPDGRVLNPGHRWQADSARRVNTRTPQLAPREGIEAAARHLGIEALIGVDELDQRSGVEQQARYSGGNLSAEAIPVELVYEPVGTELRLAWRLVVDRYSAEQKLLDMRVDAVTGDVVGVSNWVAHGGPDHSASYRVFPAPFESPGHPGANAVLVTDPFDLQASPRGWHDSRNSGSGPEFTDTRGNNVLAQADLFATNNSSTRPSGGAGPDLSFDFLLDPSQQPNVGDNVSASVTNLFYWNNHIHDVLWHYGFDEPAGNFQTNNFGRGGLGNDAVRADALDGASLNPPNSNNANFGTPPDGSPGRMQMFRWLAPSPMIVAITAPFEADYEGQPAAFGGTVAADIEESIVVVNDGVAADGGQQGCQALVNAAAVNGNIALIRRGGCEFGVKALNAQNAGAVAAIVYNNQGETTISMGGGAAGGSVTIPALMIIQSAGEAIAAAAPPVLATVSPPTPAGADRDSDFDAGIIAHEYGHGVSNRLTGGPSAASCLSNEEQAGEGWSDYLGLMLTMDASACSLPRGIATYPSFQPVDGSGIRRFRYTPDMTINPFTYADIADPAQSIPHGVGSVWGSMVWDMTCALIDRDGFDPDIKNGSGGNNLGLQLVIDGLKLQSCSPSFTDARNGILAADLANNGGANQCLIWAAFARRGLGASANAGSPNSRSDGTAAFDMPASCDALHEDGFE
jgi:extracellular elastinolytic metalloproteinase